MAGKKFANIVALPGDGVGPELMQEGLKVFNAVTQKYGYSSNTTFGAFGAQAYFDYGKCYPDLTRQMVMAADAVLKGPVGLDSAGRAKLQAAGVKTEQETVIALRKDLGTYLCYRPAVVPREFAFFSPLRPEIVGDGIDILMMRELLGGLYFGPKQEGVEKDGTILDVSRDDCTYTREQIEKFAHACYKEAQQRNAVLTVVHKNNVKATGRHWKAIFDFVGKQYPAVKTQDQLVDSYATFLVTKPTSLNGVSALENMEGDIETDEAGGILGSLGLMPSACVNPETGRAYYEPSHGSAPDIAGKNTANPYSMIGSVAFMLEKSFGWTEASKDVWSALKSVFAQGYMTGELVRKLSQVQQEARAEDDCRRLGHAFKMFAAASGLKEPDEAEIKALIMHSNQKYDAGLEARVVSTSQFGDLVVKNILGK